MSGRRDDDQLNQDEFSLEAILAEFGSGTTQRQEESPAAGEPALGEAASIPEEELPAEGEAPQASSAPPRDELAEQDWFPTPPQSKRRAEAEARAAREEKKKREESSEDPIQKREGKVTEFPKPAPRIVREEAPPPLPPEPERSPEPEEKVLEFPPPEPDNPVAAGIDHLRRKADQFADHMYEEEGSESAKSVRRAEKLIPGVDEEEPAAPPVRERKPKKKLPPPPDYSPAELVKRYSKGMKSLRLRCALVFLLALAALYLTAAPAAGWVLPPRLEGNGAWQCYALAAIQAVAILLGVDEFLKNLTCPFRHKISMEFILSLANLAVLADALTIPRLGLWDQRQPFCCAAVLGLWSVMYGSLQTRKGQRLACRAAAAASEPYLVTRDEGKWNNRDTYVKWSGPLNGFGSQIQGSDGAQRIYRVVTPVILLAAVLFAFLSSVGKKRPQDLLWCLAAILTAAGSLSATLCFGLPWRKISFRLSSRWGAALAGWQGVTNTTGTCSLLLTDIDLFPVGSVSLNGVKIFGDFPIEKVVAVTATVIRDSGSGLEKVFHDLLRSQGAVYRRGEDLIPFEGGGVSEMIRGEQVLVGSASFMVLMDVALPPGLKVKNAVFCAINGELAGIFALNYHLPGTVAPAIDSLIRNRITPVLATRDFNLIPSMLRQRFKLPVEKLDFPAVHRRRELSDPDQEHSDVLTAVLCREGLGPYAEAVVGSRRLREAVRMSTLLSCLGSAVGLLLAFYLTYVAAYQSLTPLNLTLFLLMWLVPTPLIGGWVDRY